MSGAFSLSILTASRNDATLLTEFFDEIQGVLRANDLIDCTKVYLVDDFSIDTSVLVIDTWKKDNPDLQIDIISLPTNLGNQGAMAYGMRHIDMPKDGYLLTLDSDGEDDIQKIPEMIQLAKENPDKVVFTQRGQRYDTFLIRFLYYRYRWFFSILTGHNVIPNNYMILPECYLESVRRSPLIVVYYALAVLRLGLPYVHVIYDRRERYGGRSSQNIYNLMSHAFVGLMIFYETVITKIYMYLMLAILFFLGTSGFALFLKFIIEASLPGWTALTLAVNFGFIVFLGSFLALMAVCAIAFKLSNFYLANALIIQDMGSHPVEQ